MLFSMNYIAKHPISVLEALAELSPSSSKTTLRSWLKEGRVFINNSAISDPAAIITEGQTLTLGPRKKYIAGDIQILYDDKDIIILDKPSGLLSVAAAFETAETVHSILKQHYRRNVYVVHRLDQETSGVMMFALNEESFNKLKSLFEAHDIERAYTGIVEGKVEMSSGKWSSYLYEDAKYHVHSSNNPNQGRLAVTHYKTVAATKQYSKLTFNLETGRKNQIRVHCQQIGHSIVGDKKYGARSNPIKRLCLHAHLLAFAHPRTGKIMRFESPIPKEFSRLIN